MKPHKEIQYFVQKFFEDFCYKVKQNGYNTNKKVKTYHFFFLSSLFIGKPHYLTQIKY